MIASNHVLLLYVGSYMHVIMIADCSSMYVLMFVGRRYYDYRYKRVVTAGTGLL